MKELKQKVEEIVEKVKADPKLLETFKADPVKALEVISGVDLPDGMVEPLVAGVKARLEDGDLGSVLEKLEDGKLGNVVGALEGLFGKQEQ